MSISKPIVYFDTKKGGKIFICRIGEKCFIKNDKGKYYSVQGKWSENKFNAWYFSDAKEAVIVARFLAKHGG